MDDKTITLKEGEFKGLVDCGFITGYRFAVTNGIFKHLSKKEMRNASLPCGEELWRRCKKAEKNQKSKSE
jgi:hypothetical protein